ncbi:MAG: hypothetical protein EBT86_08560 [Actinobacteria bacterium]|nr:hypothetical protein [Actinomycetota bacterium]
MDTRDEYKEKQIQKRPTTENVQVPNRAIQATNNKHNQHDQVEYFLEATCMLIFENAPKM